MMVFTLPLVFGFLDVLQPDQNEPARYLGLPQVGLLSQLLYKLKVLALEPCGKVSLSHSLPVSIGSGPRYTARSAGLSRPPHES